MIKFVGYILKMITRITGTQYGAVNFFKEHNRTDSVPSIIELLNKLAGALRVAVTAELAASTSYSSMINSGVGATTSRVFRSTTVRTCTQRLLQLVGSEKLFVSTMEFVGKLLTVPSSVYS